MQLQVTLDSPDLGQCIEVLEQVHQYVDIVEVGNPLLIDAGLSLVQNLRREFPQVEICADAKIVNSGHYIASRCFEAGATMVTVMGVTADQTIEGAVAAAQLAGATVMADLTGVSDMANRSQELEELGVDYLCCHTSFEDRNRATNPFSDAPIFAQAIRSVFGHTNDLRELDLVKANIHGMAKTAVVGRISEENIDEVVEHDPDLVIVGRAIMGAIAPAHAAADLREAFVR